MLSRIKVLTNVLAEQLVRIGRPRARLTIEPDYIMTLTDEDGHWRGPVPHAFGALVACNDGEGAGPELWLWLSAA
jgi:hypothetical protein